MTDPKIRYDIEANATGQAEVDALTRSFEGLDDALPPETAKRAEDLARSVEQLGRQKQVLQIFQGLGQAARDANRNVADLETQFNDLRREIEASDNITARQSGRLQKLSEELQKARDRAASAGEALNQARTQLGEFGLAGTTLAKTGDALKSVDTQAELLKDDLKALSGEVGRLRDGQQIAKALESSFRELGIRGVQSVEREVSKLQQKLAEIRANPDVLPVDKARAVEAFNQRLAELRREAGGAKTGLDQVGQAATNTGTSLASATQRAVAWTAALVGIGSGSQIVRSVVETGAAFETLRGRLDSLLGSTQAADAAFERIKNLATTTPFEVAALTESFAKLTAFGLQPTDEQMRALTDTAATLGGGTESLAGVTTALGQAWAKGKLQGEEILQLAERGVPVWDALARATGRTEQELQKMSSAGQLGRDVIKQLIDELGRQNFGASATLMDTFNGAVSNAKDALSEFYDLIARSGVLEYLTGQLQDALAEFERMKDTGELERRAKAVADTFIAIAEAASTAVDIVSEFSGAITLLVQAMVAQRIVAFVASLNLVGPAAAAAATQVRAAAVSMQSATVATGAIATASGVATAALTRMGLALASLAKLALPLVLINAIGTLAFKFFEAKAAAEEGDRAVRRMLETPVRVNAPKAAADQATDAFKRAETAVDRMGQEVERIANGSEAAEKKLQGIVRAADGLVDKAGGVASFGKALADAFYGGKISAEEVGKAWEDVVAKLNTEELARFESQLRSAFAAGRLGAQTLADTLDIAARQAVKNAGQDFEQLATGIGKATREILGQVDGLVRSYDRLKSQGADAGALIFEKITQAIQSAKTQEELRAIEQRIVDIGKAAPAAGGQVADALDAIGKRAEALTAELSKSARGVKELEEAYRTLGLTSTRTASETAAKLGQAYRLVAADVNASAEIKAAAFQKYANAAIAASGGVVSAEMRVRAEMMGLVVDTDEAGRAIVRTRAEAAKAAEEMVRKFGQARESVKGVGGQVEEAKVSFGQLEAAASKAGAAIVEAANLGGQAWAKTIAQQNAAVKSALEWRNGNTGASDGSSVLGPGGGAVSFEVPSQYTPPDNSGDWYFDVDAWRAAGGINAGFTDAAAKRFWKRKSLATQRGANSTRTPFGGPAGAPASAYPINPYGGRVVTVDLRVNGGQAVPLTGPEETVDNFIRALEDARRATGS